ncbi:2-oxo acid dehydrogenase subunit E2 [Bdellovibrionota bacterium FG-2]
MSLFTKNVNYKGTLKLSPWRKVAIGTWRTVGDPSVYGMMDIDVGAATAYIDKLKNDLGVKLSLTHFVGKLMAETLSRHPDINCVLRFGRLYQRKTVDVFFQIASDDTGKDLSGTVIREAERKSLAEIARELQLAAREIREKGDPAFKKMKGLMGGLPGILSRYVLDFAGFILYTLNLWSPLLGAPRDSFGSVMVTSIGSLGLDSAFAPIVPYSRCPLLITVGVVRDMPVVQDGQIVIRPIVRLCATFDHRLIDGMHASHMVRTIMKIFKNPEAELK